MDHINGIKLEDVERIQSYVSDLIKNHPDIAKSHTAVMQLVGMVMSKFKGGLGPIQLRPLVTVALYGDSAVDSYLNALVDQLVELDKITHDRPILSKRISDTLEMVYKLQDGFQES